MIAHGLFDLYWVGDEDIHKDANAVIQQLSEALELAEEELKQRGKSMPAHLVIQADNTCRENKNQWCLKFAAALVASGRFKTVTWSFLRTGHTHEPLMQWKDFLQKMLLLLPNLKVFFCALTAA